MPLNERHDFASVRTVCKYMCINLMSAQYGVQILVTSSIYYDKGAWLLHTQEILKSEL